MCAKFPPHVDRASVLSAGLLGLVRAAEAFDPKVGASFKTYARRRISGTILDELRAMDWVPRLARFRAKRDGTEHLLKQQVSLKTDGENEFDVGLAILEDHHVEETGVVLERREELAALFRGMTANEKLVVVLVELAGWTMWETGKVMGLSEGRISQIHTSAFTWMKRVARGRG